MQTLLRFLIACLFIAVPLGAQPRAVPPIPPVAPLPQAPPIQARIYAQMIRPGGPYLGVGLLEVDSDRAKELGLDAPAGVEISSVAEDSPAEQAGLMKNDVILEFRGQPVVGVEHFIRLVRETPVGREVPLAIWRQKARMSLNVTVGERKEQAKGPFFWCADDDPDCEPRLPNVRLRMPHLDIDIPRPRMMTQSRFLGVEIESLEEQLAEYFGVEQGLLVRSVNAESPAARAGVQAGDVIVAVAGRPVKDTGDLRRALQSVSPEKPVEIQVVRNRSERTLSLEPRRDEDRRQGFRGRRIRALRGERL